MPGSSIPIQQPEGIGLGCLNPLRSTGQSFTSGSQILGTLPQAGGHLLVVEPDYLPDSEVLAFSHVYTP
jgi:hypothetical protein